MKVVFDPMHDFTPWIKRVNKKPKTSKYYISFKKAMVRANIFYESVKHLFTE